MANDRQLVNGWYLSYSSRSVRHRRGASMIGFIVGLFIGCFLGMFIVSACVVAKRADDVTEEIIRRDANK